MLAFSSSISISLLLLLFAGKVTPALSYFPEQDMTVPELAAYFGYPCETVLTETDDGYLLTMHRIPFGKNSSKRLDRPLVFLQHGLLGSSADWTTNIPSQSAAYVFADAGFDVWMGNVRGNVYSNRHRTHSHLAPAFWNFSFDEMALIDIPTMLETALNISGQPKLYYVGHSQGTAIMFAKGSLNDRLAARVEAFFALAPVTTVAHIKGLMGYIGSHFVSHMGKLIEIFGAYEFLPSNVFSKFFAFLVCGTGFMNPLCGNVLWQIGGPDSKDINMTRVMVYMDHTPAGTSTKNIVHWAQMTQSGKFCKYDYGAEKNQEIYGSLVPPEYNITNHKIPTYLYYSEDDWLADPADVEGTIIARVPKTVIKESNHVGIYNHLDYIWGMHAVDKLYLPIVDRMRKHEALRRNRP